MTREEAINEIKSWDFLEGKEIEAIHTLIPELTENEDERIRKEIVFIVKQYGRICEKEGDPCCTINDCLAYLEKQEIFSKGEGCYYYADGSYTFIGSMGLGPIEDITLNGERPKTENKGVDLPGATLCVEKQKEPHKRLRDKTPWIVTAKEELAHAEERLQANLEELHRIRAEKEKQKEQKPIIQDVELNDAVYDYVRDHFIAGADFTPEYIKKLMENAFFAGVDYYLLKQESESCEPDTNVEKVIEDVIRVYGKTQGEWVGGYDVDTLIVNLRRAFNKKEQKPIKWTELTWKDINELERIINNVHYEFQNGIGEDSFGELVLERFRGYKDDDSMDEQKQEWSEKHIADIFEKVGLAKIAREQGNDELTNALQDAMLELSKVENIEWSEEDKEKIVTISEIIEHCTTIPYSGGTLTLNKEYKKELLCFIRTLRPSWKPSEEQMNALEAATVRYQSTGLKSLYEDLKKL